MELICDRRQKNYLLDGSDGCVYFVATRITDHRGRNGELEGIGGRKRSTVGAGAMKNAFAVWQSCGTSNSQFNWGGMET